MTKKEYQRAIVTIPKDTLATLPAAEYKGKIIVVNSLERLQEALDILNKAEIIGFDTETRPSFRKGQYYNVSLMQLSTPDCCFLIRTKETGYPRELVDFLQDPGKLKVGLSIHDDFHNLRKSVDIEPRGFIDLQQYVKDYKIADNSLSRLYAILFNERISKGQRLTNWEAPELTEAQQAYAALDAYACIRIYNHLKSGKFNPRDSRYLSLPPLPDETEETLPDNKP